MVFVPLNKLLGILPMSLHSHAVCSESHLKCEEPITQEAWGLSHHVHVLVVTCIVSIAPAETVTMSSSSSTSDGMQWKCLELPDKGFLPLFESQHM
jgi:hypothetical protein